MAPVRSMQNGYVESFNSRARDETLFLSMGLPSLEPPHGVEGYNQDRPYSSKVMRIPTAFTVKIDKQWPASLCPAGSATQAIASTALMRNKAIRL
jgi:putative transposase